MSYYSIIIVIVGMMLFSSCSSGNNSPVSRVDELNPENHASEWSQGNYSAGILGVYDLNIDVHNQTADLTFKRNASIGESYLLNGISYFTTFPCSSCFTINGIGFDFDKIILDFKINHPMDPGDPSEEPSGINRLDLDIFDLALVVRPVGHTPVEYVLTDQSIYLDVLSKPDGYTSELTEIIADPAALPYILVVDDSDTYPPASTFNEFPMGASEEFKVGFLNELGETLQFELYLTFAYGWSATWETRFDPIYYNPEFNRKAAWKVEASPHNAWFSFDSSTPVNVEVKVYDWQIGANVDAALANPDDIYEASDVSSISVEIPGMHNSLQTFAGDQFASGTGTPGDPLIYNFPIANENNLPGGEYTGIVKVTDQRLPKEPAESRDFLVNSPDGILLEPYQLAEFATYQTFKAIISDEIVFNPVDVTPPWLNMSSHDVEVEGNYAFVTEEYNGVHVFDISDPENLTWVTMIDTPGSVKDIKIQNGYAYVSDFYYGAMIIDIDPIDSMHIVKSFTEFTPARRFFPAGDYAYLAADSELHIVDIQDPTAAEIINTIDVSGWTFSVYAAENYVYLCERTAGLSIIDVEEPLAPEILNTINPVGQTNDCIVRDGYAFVASDSQPGYLHIIDVRDPLTASVVKSVEIGDRCYNVFLSGEYAYLTTYSEYLKIVDIDPIETAEVVEAIDIRGVQDVFVQGQYAFATNTQYGLQSIYLDPPASSYVVDSYEAVNFTSSIAIYDDYLLNTSQWIKVIDVSDPATAYIAHLVETANARPYGLAVNGNQAYLGDGLYTFTVLDISSIENPQIIGTSEEGNGYLNDFCYEGGYVYTRDGSQLISVFDVDPPETPVSVATLDIPNSIKTIACNGDYLYVTDSLFLHIADISDPENPTIVKSFDPGYSVFSADADDEYAYVGCGFDKFVIVDINPPDTAEVINTVIMPADGYNVCLMYGYAFVNCSYSVVIVDVDPVDSAHIETIIEIPEGNSIDLIHVENGYVYIALKYGAGIRIIDLW